MATARKVARKIREVFPDKSRVAMHIEGLDIAHAHLKLFPFSTDEEFRHHPDMNASPITTLSMRSPLSCAWKMKYEILTARSCHCDKREPMVVHKAPEPYRIR
jgi:hypothetical protein